MRQRMLVSKLLTSRLLVDLNQWLMEYVLQWVGSDRTCRVLDAGSGREDESSEVCCVGERRQSFSEN